MSHYSFAPIDVGFDLRGYDDILIEVPDDATSIETPAGVRVSGTRARLIAALISEGVSVLEEDS